MLSRKTGGPWPPAPWTPWPFLLSDPAPELRRHWADFGDQALSPQAGSTHLSRVLLRVPSPPSEPGTHSWWRLAGAEVLRAGQLGCSRDAGDSGGWVTGPEAASGCAIPALQPGAAPTPPVPSGAEPGPSICVLTWGLDCSHSIMCRISCQSPGSRRAWRVSRGLFRQGDSGGSWEPARSAGEGGLLAASGGAPGARAPSPPAAGSPQGSVRKKLQGQDFEWERPERQGPLCQGHPEGGAGRGMALGIGLWLSLPCSSLLREPAWPQEDPGEQEPGQKVEGPFSRGVRTPDQNTVGQ